MSKSLGNFFTVREIGEKYDVTAMPVNCEQLKKEDIKRMLAIYFEVSMNGEDISDTEGEAYLEVLLYENI